MKTVVTTALSVFTLAVFFQVQGIAEGEDVGLQVIPTPAQPETWNVWGEAELDGVTWTVQPVACDVESPTALCVEVAVHNPTFNVVTSSHRISVWANNNEPMARMGSIPTYIDGKNVDLQASGGQTVRTILTLAVPEVVVSQLELRIGTADVDPWGGLTVASFTPTGGGLGGLVQEPELSLNVIGE